jgi:hypothetical protein
MPAQRPTSEVGIAVAVEVGGRDRVRALLLRGADADHALPAGSLAAGGQLRLLLDHEALFAGHAAGVVVDVHPAAAAGEVGVDVRDQDVVPAVEVEVAQHHVLAEAVVAAGDVLEEDLRPRGQVVQAVVALAELEAVAGAVRDGEVGEGVAVEITDGEAVDRPELPDRLEAAGQERTEVPRVVVDGEQPRGVGDVAEA